MDNYDQDNNVLTKSDNENIFPIKFHPMPKRFMVWDTKTRSFCESKNHTGRVFDLIELANFIMLHAGTGRPHTDFVVVQSTGLFDKNGTEIFEGDIIQYNQKRIRSDELDTVGVVYWYGDGAGYAFDYKGEECMLFRIGEYCKVIGNIFENPDLLEKNNE